MKAKIVYVEDERALRENFTEIFEEAGFEVTSFGAPLTAVQLRQLPRPDLFVLDISMGSDHHWGLRACGDILAAWPDARVVFLTSRTDLTARGENAGAVASIAKDDPADTIVCRLQALVSS